MNKKKILLITTICSLIIVLGIILSTVFIFVPSSKYSKAINYYKNGDLEMAEELFVDLGNYKDSKQQLIILDAHENFNNQKIESGIELICSIDGNVTVMYDFNNGSESFTETLDFNDYKLYTEHVYVGYCFQQWELLSYSIDNTQGNYSASILIKAIWVAETDTRYTVNYYLENYEDANYTLNKSDVLFGTTLSTVTPEVYEYEGFIAPKSQTVDILPDGSTELNYYYQRELITLSFVTNGGIAIEDFETKWGTPIDDLPIPTRENYTFGGWYNDMDLSQQCDIFKSNSTLYAYWTEEYKPSEFTYELLDEEYILLGTSLEKITKLIPTYIGGKKLSTIATNALSNLEVDSLIIPNTVICIEENVFENSIIEEVILPASVIDIQNDAFRNVENLSLVKYNGTISDWCNISFGNELANPLAVSTEFYLLCDTGYELITELVIPNEIKSLGNYQFYGFDTITSVVIDKSILTIGENVFTNSNNISSLNVPFIGSCEEDISTSYLGYFFGASSYALNSNVVPSSLKSITITNTLKIDDYALYDCDMISEINLSSPLLEIGNLSFANTSINNIKIPNSVTTIGYGAFKYCQLESIDVPFAGNNLENESIDNGHFGWIFGAYYSYENNDYVPTSLKTISITNALEIDEYAFEGLNNVETINLSNTLLRINSNAFKDCTALEYIHIPSNVEVVEENIFNGIDDLVIYVESVATMNGWDQDWNTNDKPVYYGVNQSSFYEENQLQFVIADGVAILTNCLSDEAEITIPKTIDYCDNTYIVTTIGKEAFYRCDNLEKVTMISIEIIEESAFENCSNLHSVQLSDNLIILEEYAFYNTNVEIYNIPKNVTSIGLNALTNNNNVIVYCEGTPTVVSNTNLIVYYDVTSETYLEQDGICYVIKNNEAVVTDYLGSGENVNISETIVIGEKVYKVTTIGSYAFDGNSIKVVKLSSSIMVIESYAFNNCNLMTSINLTKNVTNINYRAFNNCPNLIIYTEYNQREVRDVWGNNWYYGINYISYNN